MARNIDTNIFDATAKYLQKVKRGDVAILSPGVMERRRHLLHDSVTLRCSRTYPDVTL